MSHLQHGAPGHIPEILGVSLPGSLDSHSAREEQVHQLQQLHRHVPVFLDQLLVTALISVVSEKSKVKNQLKACKVLSSTYSSTYPSTTPLLSLKNVRWMLNPISSSLYKNVGNSYPPDLCSLRTLREDPDKLFGFLAELLGVAAFFWSLRELVLCCWFSPLKS